MESAAADQADCPLLEWAGPPTFSPALVVLLFECDPAVPRPSGHTFTVDAMFGSTRPAPCSDLRRMASPSILRLDARLAPL